MPRYRLKVADEITGPFSETALEEMASVRVFDADDLLAPEPTEDWKPVRAIPELHIRFFPPRKTITLKAKAIEIVPQENNEPVTVDQILRDNLAAEAATPRKRLRRLPNRRRRDFLFSILLLNGIIWGGYYYLPHSKEIEVAAISAASLFTLGCYWLFYQIMDRY